MRSCYSFSGEAPEQWQKTEGEAMTFGEDMYQFPDDAKYI